MSFELGLLMGLGRSALKERESRAEQEKLAREQSEAQNRQSLQTLQKLVETDNLLPDEARNIAAQRLVQLATNPKAKDTDYTKAVQDIFSIANRPRPTPQTIAANAVRTVASPDYSFLNGIAPGMGTATNEGMRQSIPHLPAPETVSGILSTDERNAREETDMRRKLALQQEFAGTRFTPFSDTQGLVDNQGNVVRAPNPAPPRPDTGRTPFEVLIDPNATPEQKAIAKEAMTLQWTNRGDQTSGGGGGGKPPRYTRQIFQNPDGTFVEVLTNPHDPSEPPIRRDLGSGIDKPMNDATKNTKAQTESTMQMIGSILNQFKTGAVDPKDVFGRSTSIGYAIRASGWVPGLAPPPEVVTAIRTDVANINNELIKLRSGAAVSASEFSRLEAELSIAVLDPTVVVDRLNAMLSRLQRIYRLRFGPNGVGDANTFPGDVEAGAGASTPTPAPGRLPAPPPPPGFVPLN